MSPTLFDIVVDCILREWYRRMGTIDEVLIFYADDGRLAGYKEDSIQQGLDLLRELFGSVGLHFNTTKTKAMISVGSTPYGCQSSIAYKRRYDHSLPTYRQRKLAKVTCSFVGCGKALSSQYLPTHM